MRIKALAACAKDDGLLTLLDEVDEEGEVVRQYVMLRNRAIYPLDGMPLLNEQTLLTVMDVPKEKHSAYQVDRARMSERLKLMVEDCKASDVEMQRGHWGLAMNGLVMTPVFSWNSEDERVWFVETDLLKVLADERGVELYLRKVDGSHVLVAMLGMVTIGCLTPCSAHWHKAGAHQLRLVGQEAAKIYDRFCEAERHEAAE